MNYLVTSEKSSTNNSEFFRNFSEFFRNFSKLFQKCLQIILKLSANDLGNIFKLF